MFLTYLLFFSVTRDEAAAFTIDTLNSFPDYDQQNAIRKCGTFLFISSMSKKLMRVPSVRKI